MYDCVQPPASKESPISRPLSAAETIAFAFILCCSQSTNSHQIQRMPEDEQEHSPDRTKERTFQPKYRMHFGSAISSDEGASHPKRPSVSLSARLETLNLKFWL